MNCVIYRIIRRKLHICYCYQAVECVSTVARKKVILWDANIWYEFHVDIVMWAYGEEWICNHLNYILDVLAIQNGKQGIKTWQKKSFFLRVWLVVDRSVVVRK